MCGRASNQDCAVAAQAVDLGQPVSPKGTRCRTLVALPAPAAADDTGTAVSASYDEVVALALPSVTELATTPSVLSATALAVPGAPPVDELASSIGVELLPGSSPPRPPAFLRPFRPRLSASESVLDALVDAGRGPVAVLDGADPVLATRIVVLQRAANRPVRVVGTAPGLGSQVRSLETELAQNAAYLGVNGDKDRAGVVALVDRRRTRPDDVTVAISALPEDGNLLAVVWSDPGLRGVRRVVRSH